LLLTWRKEEWNLLNNTTVFIDQKRRKETIPIKNCQWWLRQNCSNLYLLSIEYNEYIYYVLYGVYYF